MLIVRSDRFPQEHRLEGWELGSETDLQLKDFTKEDRALMRVGAPRRRIPQRIGCPRGEPRVRKIRITGGIGAAGIGGVRLDQVGIELVRAEERGPES